MQQYATVKRSIDTIAQVIYSKRGLRAVSSTSLTGVSMSAEELFSYDDEYDDDDFDAEDDFGSDDGDEELDEFDEDADFFEDDPLEEDDDIDEPYDDYEEEDGYGAVRDDDEDLSDEDDFDDIDDDSYWYRSLKTDRHAFIF